MKVEFDSKQSKKEDQVKETKTPDFSDRQAAFFADSFKGEVELKGRKFKFNIPDPFDGCAIYNYSTKYSTPFGSAFSIDSLKPMPPDVLKEYMRTCLHNCVELLSSGQKAPVVDESGHIGIMNASAPLLDLLMNGFSFFFVQFWAKENPFLSVPEI